MMPFRKFLLVFVVALLTLISFSSNAQDSSRLRVSLLTCSPGEELYSIFGHSAIRIIDSNSVTDYVFNYGTFDFDDPNFYIKFVKGKLLYFISIERTNDFIEFYKYENRSVSEQVLSLSAEEKIAINDQKKLEKAFKSGSFSLQDFAKISACFNFDSLKKQSEITDEDIKNYVENSIKLIDDILYSYDTLKIVSIFAQLIS
jgi:hypothetical protein